MTAVWKAGLMSCVSLGGPRGLFAVWVSDWWSGQAEAGQDGWWTLLMPGKWDCLPSGGSHGCGSGQTFGRAEGQAAPLSVTVLRVWPTGHLAGMKKCLPDCHQSA